MPEGAVAPRPRGQAPPPQQQQQQGGGGGFPFNKLILGAVVYFGINLGISYYNRKEQTGVSVTHPETGEILTVPDNIGDVQPYQLRPKQLDEGVVPRQVPVNIAPIWAQDSHVDIVVTLSPSFSPSPIDKTPADWLVLDEKDFHINNYSDKRAIDTTFKVPKSVQNNGTLWGHFYVGLTGSTLDPSLRSFDPGRAYHFTWPLTQYLTHKKAAKARNLLDNSPEEDDVIEEDTGPVVTNHYHPNSTFVFVPDLGVKDFRTLPPAVRSYVHLETTNARDKTGQHGWYYPVLFVNTFWQLKSHMIVLNDTVTELPLHIDLKNLAAWQFQIMSNMEANAKETARQAAYGGQTPGGGDGNEIEMIKEIFIDTNPYLLAITAMVTVAHLILETLAFGSDIAHYRKKKDNVGISVRSILANVFMQTIIFLYLLDNQQNTSWMILGTQVVGIVIEFWKVTTVVDVRMRPTEAGSWLPYWFVFEDKHKLTDTEEKTKEYDEVAFKYMYIAGVPLLIAYGIYSLIYDTHKSWYSYIIATLVGSVYAYGFLMMVPSLYINYRLKSVAHMPAKAMMYKFVNTFIDDLFAFTIKMPFLHRLSTFRDDIIFFIYIYQRWAYRIDYSRVNEFGQGGEDEEEEKTEAKGKELLVEAVKETEAKATGADTGKAKKRK